MGSGSGSGCRAVSGWGSGAMRCGFGLSPYGLNNVMHAEQIVAPKSTGRSHDGQFTTPLCRIASDPLLCAADEAPPYSARGRVAARRLQAPAADVEDRALAPRGEDRPLRDARPAVVREE